ncbi:hypothetical protein K7W42_01900 [Deinococcus sp. HMF7604]|uniref:hypothetical protein n=1 Tax=Deinococcus betulae TaxID=2873312 RepID=UPI001CCC95B6|nr:hypothetical protein [Deinococcus betulae]MBZ9749609.1 hypothetical protein [Deinococcus betulae]
MAGGKRGRQALTESWLQTAVQSGRPFGLLGPCPLSEILAAPSAACSEIRHLLLDVADTERVRRLRARGDGQATQETLNWAA